MSVAPRIGSLLLGGLLVIVYGTTSGADGGAGGAPAATTTTAAAPPTQPDSLELYGRLPTVGEKVLSPDGTKIALMRTVGEDSTVMVVSLDTQKALGSAPVGKSKLRDMKWADATHLMLFSTTNGSQAERANTFEFGFLRIMDTDTGQISDPMDKQHFIQYVSGMPTVRRVAGDTVIFVRGYGVVAGYTPGTSMVRMNLKSGAVAPETSDNLTSNWFFDADGKLLSSQTYNQGNKRWTLRIRQQGGMREVASGKEDIEVPTIIGMNAAGDALWLVSATDDGSQFTPVSLSDGKLGEPAREVAGASEVITDRLTGRALVAVRGVIHETYQFFDAKRQELWDGLQATMPQAKLTFVNASDDFRKLLVEVELPRQAPVLVLVDAESRSGQMISTLHAGLTTLADVRAFEYQAADGMKISAVLTVPLRRPLSALPLVVLPHGGPQSHDTDRYDWWAQALAAQGYVVLKPNFRGSDGEAALLRAGFGQMGRKMQTDVSDGVAALVASGLVDAARVCVVGASYGGYVALAGVSMQKNVYRCAVSLAGVADLEEMIGTGRSMYRSDRYYDRYLGTEDRQASVLRSLSPVTHAADVTVPVLLIHGRNDSVVPYHQSEAMNKALRQAGKKVEMVTLDQEDHWLSRGDTRLQALQAMVKFLRANNPP